MDVSSTQLSKLTGKSEIPKQTTLDPSEPTNLPKDESIEYTDSSLENLPMNSLCENLEPHPKNATKCSDNEELGSPFDDAPKISCTNQLKPPLDYSIIDPRSEQLVPPIDKISENSDLPKLEKNCKDEIDISELMLKNETTPATSSKSKRMSRSVGNSDRILRCRSQVISEAPEPSNNVEDVNTRKERKRTKRNIGKNIVADEYSKFRTNFRYFLNRMGYEKNLIDVYSSEGWKRMSVDKLKPEKELERAASEILRCKRKIRDMFQRLDSLCTEGRIPESLFDSDGEIDSEDIFCAKCGAKDLSTGDDIILCDGACERAFHLLCLQPPLSMEEIPPDDEGWLCPGCDCKVDCIDMLNDSQGTTLSITHNWEKIFPEAAASSSTNPQDNLPLSDDSEEDEDYDPHAKRADENSQENNQSSDDSEDSDNTVAPAINDPLMGLPSDDSEDDDYNPTAPVPDEQEANSDNSSSDFTSDSEDDLNVPLDDNCTSGKSKRGRTGSSLNHKKPLSDDILTVSEMDVGQDDIAPVCPRRRIERLDYKKLYHDTYTNVDSSSSDDEDWTDNNDVPRNKKNSTACVAEELETNTGKVKSEIKKSSKQRTRKKLNVDAANNSPGKLQNGSSTSTNTPPSRRLGDAVTQRLHAKFKETQYLDNAAKESLASELGITAHQVNKWFANARWSFRHGGRRKAQNKNTPSTPKNNPQHDHEKLSNSEDDNEKNVTTEETNEENSKTPNTRKRKNTSNSSNEETPNGDGGARGENKSGNIKTRKKST